MKPRAASHAHFSEKWLYYSKLALFLFFLMGSHVIYSASGQRYQPLLPRRAPQLLGDEKQPTINSRVTRKFTRHPIPERNLPVTTMHLKKKKGQKEKAPESAQKSRKPSLSLGQKELHNKETQRFSSQAGRDGAAARRRAPSRPGSSREGGTRRTPVTAGPAAGCPAPGGPVAARRSSSRP